MDRVRSISMNGFMQGGAYFSEAIADGYPQNESHWYNSKTPPALYSYNKYSDIVQPRPVDVFVFSEEHPDSIDDGWMNVIASGGLGVPRWEGLPGSFHGKKTNFSFGDGHSESHKWVLQSGQSATSGNPSGTCPPVVMSATPCNTWLSGASQADLDWAQNHATALVN